MTFNMIVPLQLMHLSYEIFFGSFFKQVVM